MLSYSIALMKASRASAADYGSISIATVLDPPYLSAKSMQPTAATTTSASSVKLALAGRSIRTELPLSTCCAKHLRQCCVARLLSDCVSQHSLGPLAHYSSDATFARSSVDLLSPPHPTSTILLAIGAWRRMRRKMGLAARSRAYSFNLFLCHYRCCPS